MVERHALFGDFNGAIDAVLEATTYRVFREALVGSACSRCDLAKGRTRIVVDRGNPGARAMAIGEGPGAEEDREGLAFVGRAGRLLDEMLLEAGIEADRDLLIANIVKCRPEHNRRPRREEADACMPYLWKQFQFVKPRLVLLLGRTAIDCMLPSEISKCSLSQLVGNLIEHPLLPGIDVFPVFHPAYILRMPSRRELMVEHLRAFQFRLRQIVHEETSRN